MERTSSICALIVVMVYFSVAGITHAEEKKAAPVDPPAPKSAPDKKAVLIEASRASTDKAAESASQKKSQPGQAEENPKPPEDSAVTELRPLRPEQATKGSDSNDEKRKKKSKGGPLKKIHGTVYGGTGSGGQAAGGAVGTSTKSGKTSVYVEGQSGRAR